MPSRTVTFGGPSSVTECVSWVLCGSGVRSNVPLPFTPMGGYSPCCNTPGLPSHPEPAGLMDNLFPPPPPSLSPLQMPLPGGQSSAGRRCWDLRRAGTTSPLIPGRLIRLCWAVLGHAVPCRMVQSPQVLGFTALPPNLGFLRGSGACIMLWSLITADDSYPCRSQQLAETLVSGVAEGSMKSPFPGWEQGTIFKMRDDPWWLQAFLGGYANARAEG